MPTSLHYLTVNRKFIERPRILSLPLFLLFSHSVVSGSSATPWTVTHQAPLSMGFPRQEYWNGLPLPSPGYHPEPGIKPRSPALRADSLLSAAAAAAKSLQSCPTLCDPTDGSPPGSAVPGILQARTLEWVAISFSNA